MSPRYFLKHLFVVSMIMVNLFLLNPNLGAQERDPFISILDLQKQKISSYKNKIDLSKVVLRGIIWNQKQPVAIINDELVVAGQEWQGYKLERIDKDSILLTDGTNTYKLGITEEMPNPSKTNLSVTPEPLESQMPKVLDGMLPPALQENNPNEPRDE